MTYQIHITARAEEDLNQAVDYIDHILLNPDASDSLLDEADEKIGDLATFPEKHQPVPDPVLNAWGIRFVTVKKYIAFYIISKDTKTVHIIRFLHEKRNWIRILRKGFSLD